MYIVPSFKERGARNTLLNLSKVTNKLFLSKITNKLFFS